MRLLGPRVTDTVDLSPSLFDRLLYESCGRRLHDDQLIRGRNLTYGVLLDPRLKWSLHRTQEHLY